jgi:hypothetical protein
LVDDEKKEFAFFFQKMSRRGFGYSNIETRIHNPVKEPIENPKHFDRRSARSNGMRQIQPKFSLLEKPEYSIRIVEATQFENERIEQ